MHVLSTFELVLLVISSGFFGFSICNLIYTIVISKKIGVVFMRSSNRSVSRDIMAIYLLLMKKIKE